MGFPLAVGLYFQDGSFLPLLYSMITTLACGGLLILFNKQPSGTSIDNREGLVPEFWRK